MKFMCCCLAMASLTLCGFTAAYGDCPNEKATPVPANDLEVGPVQHCNMSITLFGVPLEIEGPDCYQTIFHFPAHDWCNEAYNPGTTCASKAPLPVTKETCHCGVSLFGVHVLLPICTCSDDGTAGTCPDAETQPCPMATHPPH